jgi:hypothetical protein
MIWPRNCSPDPSIQALSGLLPPYLT